nr:hypothetical protein [Ochrobactrum sp. LM19]
MVSDRSSAQGAELKLLSRRNHYYFIAGAVTCLALAGWAHVLAEKQSVHSRALVGQIGEIIWRVSQAREKSITVQKLGEKIQQRQADAKTVGEFRRNLSYMSINLQDVTSLRYAPAILPPNQIARYRSLLERVNKFRDDVGEQIDVDGITTFASIQRELFDLSSNSSNLSHISISLHRQFERLALFRTLSFGSMALLLVIGIWFSQRIQTMKATLRHVGDYSRLFSHQTTGHTKKIIEYLSGQPPDVKSALDSAQGQNQMLKWMQQFDRGDDGKTEPQYMKLGLLLGLAGRVRDEIIPTVNVDPSAANVLVPSIHMSLILQELIAGSIKSIKSLSNPSLIVSATVTTQFRIRKTLLITVIDNRSLAHGESSYMEQSAQAGVELTRFLVEDMDGTLSTVSTESSCAAIISYRLT